MATVSLSPDSATAGDEEVGVKVMEEGLVVVVVVVVEDEEVTVVEVLSRAGHASDEDNALGFHLGAETDVEVIAVVVVDDDAAAAGVGKSLALNVANEEGSLDMAIFERPTTNDEGGVRVDPKP